MPPPLDDSDYPSLAPTSVPVPAPTTAAKVKSAECVEVKRLPNRCQGIINLDYATVASSAAVHQRTRQLKQGLNRTPAGGPQQSPANTGGLNTTIITVF